MTADFPLTREEFRQWLASRPDEVFIQCDGERCPIARALGDGWRVAPDNYIGDRWLATKADRFLPLPAWAETFAEAFDFTDHDIEPADAAEPESQLRVRGYQALRILDSIPR